MLRDINTNHSSLYSIHDIAIGDEISVSILPHHSMYLPTEERLKELRTIYHSKTFICRCSRCTQTDYSFCPNDRAMEAYARDDVSQKQKKKAKQKYDTMIQESADSEFTDTRDDKAMTRVIQQQYDAYQVVRERFGGVYKETHWRVSTSVMSCHVILCHAI